MKFKHFVLLSLFMLSANISSADVAVPYGEGAGKVDFFNYKKYPGLEEPYPIGPASFRVVGDKIWVVDSAGGKLMEYTSSGKLVSEFSVAPKGKKAYFIDQYNMPTCNMFIEDIAPAFDEYGKVASFWLVDSINKKIINYSVEGDRISEFTYSGFIQPFRIEVGKRGHLFVADKGSRSIFTLTVDGEFINNIRWEWSGMAVAGSDEKLYRLMYVHEERKNMLVCTNLSGKVIKSQLLDVEDTLNPTLWWVDEAKKECVLSYTPASGFEGSFKVVRVGLDGVTRGETEIPAPTNVNRFIDYSNSSGVYISKCDFYNAPDGKFEVVPFRLP